MNKLLVSAAILFLLISPVVAQDAADKDKLKIVNGEVISKYQAGKFDDALKAAKIALSLTLAIYGAEHIETAVSYANVGEIYRVKLKYRESADNLQLALAIYQKDLRRNGTAIAKTMDSLGIVLTLDKRQAEAEPIFTQAVANAERIFGKEAKQTLPSLKTLTDFYIYTKQYDRADEVFLKRYMIQYILVQKKDTEGIGDVSDDHYCYMSQHFKGEDRSQRAKAFHEKVEAQRIARFGEAPLVKPDNTIRGGVINGKAISLPKPPYPASARSSRASGVVSVKVVIDENGKVTSAKAYCGNPVFFAVTEAAAMKAKFSPTSLSGRPVKVSGVITYNFIP